MNEEEKHALFVQLVESKIVETEIGQILLPIGGLKEYHDKVCPSEDETCYLNLQLLDSEQGIYKYALGGINSDEVEIDLLATQYYDFTTGDLAVFDPPDLLVESIPRLIESGEVLCDGFIKIDYYGRAWLTALISDDIKVSGLIFAMKV